MLSMDHEGSDGMNTVKKSKNTIFVYGLIAQNNCDLKAINITITSKYIFSQKMCGW